MGRRKKRKKRSLWKWVLLVLALAWLIHYGRFFLPRRIVPPREIQPIEVAMKTTSYCHCRKCCSYNWFLFIPFQRTGFLKFRLKHVGETSSGAMVRPGSIAADTNLYPYGTIMFIPGYGYGRVEDTGGAIKGQHIDLYRPNHWYARRWGVRAKTVKVWYPPDWEPRPPGEPEPERDKAFADALWTVPAPTNEVEGPSMDFPVAELLEQEEIREK